MAGGGAENGSGFDGGASLPIYNYKNYTRNKKPFSIRIVVFIEHKSTQTAMQ
jgi:hypothetical protein